MSGHPAAPDDAAAGAAATASADAAVPADAGVTAQPWQALRRFTAARIALGRAGHSLPTQAHLAFQLAHAQARDAVHLPFEPATLAHALHARGLATLSLHSAATDRSTYLRRPDLGRRLDEAARAPLLAWAAAETSRGAAPPDLALVLADGLSALAVHRHAVPLIDALRHHLQADAAPWTLAPVVLASQARVALGDEVGELLRARLVVVLIGERPGLSSPDSLGLYFTWAPRVGRSDAERNCISNVRPEGLPIGAAAAKLHGLLVQARQRRLSGVALKDEQDGAVPTLGPGAAPFALAPPQR